MILRYLRDDTGAESLEWVAIAAITIVAIMIVYNPTGGNIIQGLNDATFMLRITIAGILQ